MSVSIRKNYNTTRGAFGSVYTLVWNKHYRNSLYHFFRSVGNVRKIVAHDKTSSNYMIEQDEFSLPAFLLKIIDIAYFVDRNRILMSFNFYNFRKGARKRNNSIDKQSL